MKKKEYNRLQVLDYAKKWALDRNPKFYNYENIGGDCTNFASQCIFSGCGIMNYDKNLGWYYNNANNKSPSWTGVEFLHNFLINNKGVGPFGNIVDMNRIELGDLIQLSFDGNSYSHSLIVVKINYPITLDTIFIAAHTYDVWQKTVADYIFQKIRFIHIEGVHLW